MTDWLRKLVNVVDIAIPPFDITTEWRSVVKYLPWWCTLHSESVKLIGSRDVDTNTPTVRNREGRLFVRAALYSDLGSSYNAKHYNQVVAFGDLNRSKVTFRSSGMTEVRAYAVTGGSGKPIVCMPLDSLPALFASCNLASHSLPAKLARFAGALMSFIGISRNVAVIGSYMPTPLERWLSNELRTDHMAISWSSGTPGAYRKTTVQVMSETTGSPIAFLKIANSEWSRSALRNEHEMLLALGEISIRGSGIPRVITTFDTGETFGLLTDTVRNVKSGTRLGKPHLQFLRELVEVSESEGTIQRSNFKQEILVGVEELKLRGDINSAARLSDLLCVVEESLGGTVLPEVMAHRDFTPWNVKVKPNGHVFVIDWENGRRSWLPCLDAFQFEAMPLLLQRRYSGEIWKQHTERWSLVCRKLGMSETVTLPLFGAFLIDIGVYYALARARAPMAGTDVLLGRIMTEIDSISAFFRKDGQYR